MTTISNGESGLSVRTKLNDVLQHIDGTSGTLVINESGADVDFRVESDTNANALFVEGSSGRVGFGTSSPADKLSLEVGASNAGVSIYFSGTEVGSFRNDSGNATINANNASLKFATGGTERMRINSSGNVGIGTSSPTNLLDVNADSIRVRTAQTPASASAAGNQGEIAWDADYIYVCVATDTWKRVAIATW